jgi:hypothetical protein
MLMRATVEGVDPMATLPEINEEVIVERCPYCGVLKHLRCSFCRREVHETVWPDNKQDFFALKHNYDYSYVVCIDCWNKGERWPEPVVEETPGEGAEEGAEQTGAEDS